jgi:arabinofuranosyltransferase
VPHEPKEASDQGFPEGQLSKTTTSRRRLAPSSAHPYAVLCLGASFVVWASLFIYNSSFIGIDGRRYFCLIDDAMISMRYAWNLSHGSGLVWNPGEYVEGYTNLLMTLLMSVPTLVLDKVDAVLAIQIFGIVFVLANAYLLMSIADQLASSEQNSGLEERYHRLFVILAFVCGLTYYPLLYWSLMGMETGLVALLVSLGILCALRYAREHKPVQQGVLLSVSLGLAFLTRPDTLVLAVPIFVYAFLAGRSSRSGGGSAKKWTLLVVMVGIYAAFIVGAELFRWYYYGEWLPNTYTLKVSGIALTSRIENGLIFVSYFLKEVSVLVVVVVGGLVLAFRKEKLLVVSIFVVLVCYQVWAGGDVSINWRILSPAVPLMLVLGVHEILLALQYVSGTALARRYFVRGSSFLRRHVVGLLACLLVLGVLLVVNLRFLPEIAMLRDFTDVRINEERVNIAIAIERFTKPEATVGVFDAGAIPYYTGRPAIDFLGKADWRIARMAPDPSGFPKMEFFGRKIDNPGHNKYDLEYSIVKLRPTYVRGFVWGGQNALGWARSEYVMVVYKGALLNFLTDSEDVRWDEIEAAREAGEATLGTPIHTSMR